MPAQPPAETVSLVHRDLMAGRYLCRGVDEADRPLWQRSLQVRP